MGFWGSWLYYIVPGRDATPSIVRPSVRQNIDFISAQRRAPHSSSSSSAVLSDGVKNISGSLFLYSEREIGLVKTNLKGFLKTDIQLSALKCQEHLLLPERAFVSSLTTKGIYFVGPKEKTFHRIIHGHGQGTCLHIQFHRYRIMIAKHAKLSYTRYSRTDHDQQ